MVVVTAPGTGDAFVAPPVPRGITRCLGCGCLSERSYCTPECHQADRPQDWYENDEEATDGP